MAKLLSRLLYSILSLLTLIVIAVLVIGAYPQFIELSSALFRPVAMQQPMQIPLPDTGTEYSQQASKSHSTGAFSDYPLFLYDRTVAMHKDGELERMVVMLHENGEGNLWLVEKHNDRWYVFAGPLHCVLGENAMKKARFAEVGLYLGMLYGSNAAEINWNITEISEDNTAIYANGLVAPQGQSWLGGPGKALYTDSDYMCIEVGSEKNTGQKGNSVFYIETRGFSHADKNTVSLTATDMHRLAAWLSQGQDIGFVAADAGDYDWRIEAGMPESFVFLQDCVPGIYEDARYSGRDNFMGRPIEGYYGNKIVVSADVAAALKDVQALLEPKGLGLLVYDGYRPKRAVENIFDWMEDDTDLLKKEEYYPQIDKSRLRGIYLAEQSPHTLGIAVDLTICDLETGEPLDMGTGFDFFSPKSWYSAKSVTPEQQQNRTLLRQTMEQGGFTAYEKEWWHFNYRYGSGQQQYDFIIPQ